MKSIYFSEPGEFISHKAGNRKMVWIFITIAALTLFMSLFNYVNYTISKQLQTLKQMGIRMAAGADRVQIFRYYLEMCIRDRGWAGEEMLTGKMLCSRLGPWTTGLSTSLA